MARNTQHHTEAQAAVDTSFKIEFPAELDIKPDFTVKVSVGCTAEVYKTVVLHYARDTPPSYRHVYAIHVRSDKTGRLRPAGYRQVTCDTLLDVRVAIEQIADELRPKTKTVKQTVRVSGDEEDED